MVLILPSLVAPTVVLQFETLHFVPLSFSCRRFSTGPLECGSRRNAGISTAEAVLQQLAGEDCRAFLDSSAPWLSL